MTRSRHRSLARDVAGCDKLGVHSTLAARLRINGVLAGRSALFVCRLLYRNRRRTILILSSLIFTNVVLILAFAFSPACVRMYVDQVCEKSSGHLQILPRGFLEAKESGVFLEKPFALDALRAIDPSIRREKRRVVLLGVLEREGKRHFIEVKGVEPGEAIGHRLTAGETLSTQERALPPHELLVGRLVAQHLALKPGHLVMFTFVAPDGQLDDVQCRIRGITDEGSPQGDGRAGSMQLAAARRVLGLGDGCHQQLIFLEDPSQVARSVAALRAALPDGVDVVPWEEVNPQLRRVAHLMQMQLMMITSVVVVISLFGIVGILAMSVSERTREFGMLSAMGMRPAQLMGMIGVEALVVGTLTALSSSAVAYLLLANFARRGVDLTWVAGESIVLDGVRIDMILHPRPEATHFVGAFLLVWSTCLIASLWPAWRAGHLDPVEALRA